MRNLGVRITGFLIFLLCLTGVVATILLSISHNVKDVDKIGLPQIAYIFTVIFSGLSIFSANCFISKIKTHYRNHYSKILLLRAGLLVFMVYNNYGFFLAELNITTNIDKVMYFILCVLLDFGIITLLPFSFDRMLLNYSFSKEKLNNNSIIDIAKMYFLNKFFPITQKIKHEYNNNLNSLIDNSLEVEVKEIKEKPKLRVLNYRTTLRLENKKNGSDICGVNDSKESNYNSDTESKRNDDFVSVNDLEIVRNAILNNQNENNIAPSLSDLEKLTELPKRTIQAAKRELDKEGIIKTEGNKTFVVAEKELN